MEKRVFSLVIALFFGINVFSQNLSSYGFQHGIDSTKWITLTANATLVWNENNQGAKSELINMGFTFSLGEISSSYVTLKNAALYLGNHEVLDAQYSVFCHRGGFMKDSPKIVALSPSNSTPLLSTTGYLKYEVVGNAPNRVFVVETQISSYESSINQIQLHETTNDIVLVYRKNPASNGSNYYYNMGQIALSTPMGYMTLSYYANSVVYRNSASYTGTSSSVYPDNNKYLLFTRPEPSCSIPMNPKLTDYTQSSLSFTWDSEDSCSFLVAAVLDESGADSAQASAINVGSSNSYTFTNLEPNTEYDLYVCKVSGSDTSEWVHANGATLSMCAYIDSASLPYVFSNLGETFDDDSCLYVNSYFEPNSNGEYLILFTPTTLVLPPVADDVDIQRLGLRIRAKHILSVSDYSIIVGVMTDRYDLSTLVQVDTISIQEFIMYDDYWVSLSEYTGTGKYIAITNNTDRYNSYLNASTHSTEYFTYLKEIEVDYAPLCFVETSNMKVVPNIFDDNVVFINWKSEDPNANWLLEYGVSGFIPNAGYGTVLSLSTPSCTLSNLSSYYPYDVYLSKVCSQGNVSAPKLESRFRMSCYSYNLELPCFENFELHPLTYSFISLGFENSEISCNWLSYQNSTSLIPLVTYGQAHSNEKCVSLTSSTSLPSGLVSAYIHPYQVSIANLKTSFYAKNNMVNTSTAILEVGLMSSELINGIIVLDNNSYYPIDTLYLPPGMDWVEYDVDFSSFPVDSVRNHIVYKVPPISVNGRNNRSSVLIDDISIHTIPICSRPTNFVLVGTNPNSVSLKWDIDPSANAEVIYGPKDFIPYTQYTENIIETTHNNRETIYDLDSSMVYDFYVRTVCGDEEHSMWRGPITVKPGLYYVPIGYTDYETCSSKIIFNKGDNFLQDGEVAGVRLIPTDTETQFKITLPRNEVNCIMKIFLGSDTTGRLLYSSEQSEDVSEIRYIMGDVFVSVEKIHNNSSALVYAELDIKCMDVPTCPPINNIFLANVEGRSAFVRWREMMNVALNDLTGFEYKLLDRYRNEVASGETSNDYYMFSNLQPKADYTVMVRALCSNLFYSDWDSLNFTTPCVVGRDFVIKDPDTVIYENYFPYYSNSKYNYTQQLVMASEINGSANINSISFFLNGTHSTVNKTNCDIYMGHTTVTDMSNRIYVPYSDLKLVYSGEMICEQGWNTFVLDSVFNYNGIDNLVIAIDDNSGISNSSVSTKFACHLISHGSLYTYSSYNDILPSAPYTCNVMNYRNDMIFGVECDTTVECVSPSVFVVEKDTTSIHVVWAPGNLETKWLVEYKPSDENRWITVDTLRTTSKLFTDLEVNTSYDIRVVAICDDYSSSMAETVVTDKTLCTEISDVPFMEDFDSWTTEDEGFVLGCWNRLSQVNGEVNTYPKQQSLYYSYSYPKALKMVSTGTDYSLLVLPRFEYPLDTLLLSFAMYKPDNNSSHEIKVGVIEDINDLSTFEELATAYNPQGGEWKTFDFEFLNYRGRGKYIALLASDFISSPYIDNVEVSFYKECTRPYQVEVDNITQTTARVQWLDTTSSSWIVEYGLSGFERGTGSVVSTTDTFCVISNLLPNYLYDVYVYGLCMIGDTSIASFRSSFRTTCSKIVRLPYLEDFNTFRNKLPDCWHYGSRYNTDKIYVDSLYSLNGGYNLRFKSQNYNTNAYIAMLPIDSMQYQMRDIMVKFKMLKPIGSASNDTKIVLGVMIDPSDISTFTAIDTFVVSATAGVWEDVEEIQLRNYMGSGKYIAFKAISRSFVMDIAIDDIEIDLIPSCFRPLELSFTGVSDSTITFQCEERNMGTSQWVVEYGEEGYASEQRTRLIADTMPFTITGLLPDTRYAVRVASLCSEFDTSYFSDTYTLLTSSIPISLPYYYDFENEDEWYFWGGLKNSSSVKWSRGNRKSFNGEYSMYISANNGLSVSTMLQNVNASAFRDIDFGAVDTTVSVSFAALAGGNINGYEDGLAVFLVEPHYIPSISSNLLTSPWGHVDSIDILGNVIRLDTIFDKYYFELNNVSGVKRLVFFYSNGSGSPFMGVPAVVDEISLNYVSCPMPQNVTITSITPTSVSISWEGFSSSYRLYYKSLYQSDYDTLFTTADTITIRGLESDRPYEVRVEAMCENNSTSLLSAPLEFVTIQYPAQVPYYCSFEPNETETYEWEIVNGNSVNRWIIDTMAHRLGEYGLYISNNDSSNTYSIESPSTVWVYRDVYFPTTGNLQNDTLKLSIGWRCKGNYWDKALLYIGSSQMVAAGNTSDIIAPAKAEVLSTMYNDSYWKYETFMLPAEKYSGTMQRIYIAWTNGDYGDATSQPPIAIDDIAIYSSVTGCIAPVYSITPSYISAELNVIATAEGEKFRVWVKRNGEPELDTSYIFEASGPTMTVTIPNLEPVTHYNYCVQRMCDSISLSLGVIDTFYTLSLPCLPASDIRVSDITYTTAHLEWINELDNVKNYLVYYTYNNEVWDTIRLEVPSVQLEGLYSGTDYNVSIRSNCSDDDSFVSPLATYSFSTEECYGVDGVRVENISRTQATVVWQPEVNSQHTWQIVYGFEGVDENNITGISVTGEHYCIITDLVPDTIYDVYVRNVCMDGVVSAWSEKVQFRTTLNNGINTSTNEHYKITISPNPVKDNAMLNIKANNGDAVKLIITDNGGKILLEDNYYHSDMYENRYINTSTFASGTYYVAVIINDKDRYVQKLVVY